MLHVCDINPSRGKVALSRTLSLSHGLEMVSKVSPGRSEIIE